MANSLFYLHYFWQIYLSEPLILRPKTQFIQQLLFLCPCNQLAVDESIECFYIGAIFFQTVFIVLYSFDFVLLCLVALSTNEQFAAFHLSIDISVI